MVYHNGNGNKVEKKIMDILLDHARLVTNSSRELVQLVDCWKTPGRTEFNKSLKTIDKLEADANALKRSALKELTDAGPALLFRQEFMRIVRTTDQIIDLCQGAAFFLKELDVEWIPPKTITTNMEELAEKTISVTELLVDLIRALFQSVDKVIELSESIEIIENKADSNYRLLIIELAKLKDIAKGTDVMVRESVDRIEEMVDAARDVAFYIRNYAMSR